LRASANPFQTACSSRRDADESAGGASGASKRSIARKMSPRVIASGRRASR
jgi:hypothetical protein